MANTHEETGTMSSFSADQVSKIGAYLRNESNPLKGRFRALFVLRNIATPQAIDELTLAFEDDSDLFLHELAYCLGQTQREEAVPVLEKVVRNPIYAVIVRHEACEALGAIGTMDSLKVLLEHRNDCAQEVAETCELAITRIAQVHNQSKVPLPAASREFSSVDPAYPTGQNQSLDELRSILLDDEGDLYQRYQAMFSLRNMNSPESRRVLCEGFDCEKSALFRHEIAFVLGQIAHVDTIPALLKVLADTNESGMVRHEAAEALGAIGTQECFDQLQNFLHDPERLVRESCVIALDMCEYEMSNELHYADGKSIIDASHSEHQHQLVERKRSLQMEV